MLFEYGNHKHEDFVTLENALDSIATTNWDKETIDVLDKFKSSLHTAVEATVILEVSAPSI